jgi:hypothetical protein
MVDDLIHCPSCGFQLRLPTELYGTAVECPQCHSRFTAPAPVVRPAADRSPPGREYNTVARAVGEDYDRGPPSAGTGLTAPAVCLLVTSLIGVILSGFMTLTFVEANNDPEEFDRAMQQEIDRNPNLQPAQRAQAKRWMDLAREYGTATFGTLLALNLVTALGAVQMLRRRMYGLAVLGCVLALNPANISCCFLGQAPFGLWGLIALLTDDGRRAFR